MNNVRRTWAVSQSIVAFCAVVHFTFVTPASAQSDQPPAQNKLLPDDLSGEELVYGLEAARQSPDFTDSVNPLLKPYLVKGQAEPGWEAGGVDIRSELAVLPGGTEAHLLIEQSDSGPSITFFSGVELPLPAGFTTYVLKDDAANPNERSYGPYLPGFWIETASRSDLTGNAGCGSGDFSVKLHTAKPVGDWTLDEFAMTVMYYHITMELAAVDGCLVYYDKPEGGYYWRMFSPDGRPYDRTNAEAGVGQIVSAERFTAIIAGEE